MEYVAARLAGGSGFPWTVNCFVNWQARLFATRCPISFGDLNNIADLPGLPAWLAATLTKIWQWGS
jgi:hypothetical protein